MTRSNIAALGRRATLRAAHQCCVACVHVFGTELLLSSSLCRSRPPQASDAVQKLLRVVRVVQRPVFTEVRCRCDRPLGRARDDHLDIRLKPLRELGNFKPACIPQFQIGDKNIDGPMAEDLGRFCRSGCFDHPVAAAPQELRNLTPQKGIRLDQQNNLRRSCCRHDDLVARTASTTDTMFATGLLWKASKYCPSSSCGR